MSIPWRYLEPVSLGALGVFLLFNWLFFPVPTRQELVQVAGSLASYTVEPDQSWFARFKTRRTIYVLFKIDGVAGRFWNDDVTPGNVQATFTRPGIPVATFRVSDQRFHRINGDGVKTYGLYVDGQEIQAVDFALGHDSIISRYVLPVLGLPFLLMARSRWRKITRNSVATV